MKNITIADVAKHASVSKSTVSQYLNKRYDYMGEKTKERIRESIEELGYQPNIIARSLKQKSTSTIGVIVANILHAFSTQVIRTIEDICHQEDFHLIVCNADNDPEKEKKYIEMLRAKQVDGLIIFPTGGNVDLYQKMVVSKFPLVFVDRIVNEVSVPSIMLDNEMAMKLATDYLVDIGYERIAFITNSIHRNITPRIERVNSFQKALVARNITVNQSYIKTSELENVQSVLEEMLSQQNPPNAMIAGNDLTLIEVLKYAKERQLNIPDDLAVIGIDDVSFASFYTPELTTISQPTSEMGRKAALLLLEKIKNEQSVCDEIFRFEPTLNIRNSC
ncbi:LacI family DNA-binding transcriptional regulator [Litchfieldia alkalitelluris]|uniref:LacI family DNA-binding transcriptional regulator n=1 Tax=Litchfieldia alkalitelluris TaxID=304268 RepID=UPI00099666CF|nr:substrate-binding domain-containing protein [Litchfieldia alkalitelluris]